MIPSSAIKTTKFGQASVNQLVQNEELRLWKSAIETFLTKVISTINQATIPVQWNSDRQNAVAWTDGNTIFLGEHFFNDKILLCLKNRNFTGASGDIAALKALALHELSHIIWSPRLSGATVGLGVVKSSLVHRLNDWRQERTDVFRNYLPGGVTQCVRVTAQGEPLFIFNMVEDARIELRLINRYAAVAPYLIEAVASTILPHSIAPTIGVFGEVPANKVNGLTFLLLYGRKYLPKTLIDEFEKAHIALIDQFTKNGANPLPIHIVKALIDEFITLDLIHSDADIDRAYQIIQWLTYHYDNLHPFNVQSWDISPDGVTSGGGGYQNHKNESVGNPGDAHPQPQFDQDLDDLKYGKTNQIKKRVNKQELEDLQELIEELEEESLGSTSDESGDDSDSDGSSDSDKNSGSDQASSSSGDGDDADSNNSNNSADGNTAGSNPGQGDDVDAVRDAINELKRNNESTLRESARQDVESIADIRGEGSRPDLTVDLRGSVQNTVTADMRIASKTLTSAIQKLWSDGEPAWESDATSGRLNMNRVIRSQAMGVPDTNVFDQWVDSGDKNDFEIVVLVDQSSSMQTYGSSSLIDRVSQATWVIRSMCEQLNIPLTVFGYSSNSRCLFKANSRVNQSSYHILAANGNTNPHIALRWASSIFDASTARHKLLFSLTDGQWDGRDVRKFLSPVYSMRTKGVTTFFGLMLARQLPASQRTEESIRSTYDDLYGHEHLVVLDNLREFPKIVAKHITQLSIN